VYDTRSVGETGAVFQTRALAKAGAFKFRGACNAVMRLAPEVAPRGVVTHSSGNHAQALALAARLRGIPAHIVMPRNASPVKRRAVEEYGGHVVECEPTLAARETTTTSVLAETGATLMPLSNHPDVIASQGTTALELLEQAPRLDAVVVPVGGGGLLAGVTLAAKALAPAVRVFAAEPERADDAASSKAAGVLIPQKEPRTIADGRHPTVSPSTTARRFRRWSGISRQDRAGPASRRNLHRIPASAF
jgi:threonine dehydratase/serine racemase